jgi:uncharacterized protein YvpB
MTRNAMSRPWFGVYTLRSRELAPHLTAASNVADRVYLAVPHFRQQRSLSCEMASLRMAAYYLKAIHSESELVRILPRDGAQPRYENKKLIWADANRTFPGNIRGWQLYHGGMRQRPSRARRNGWGYGIYGPGIAEVATKIGLQPEVFDEVEHVYKTLDRGQVPIVIVPCGGRSTTRKWHWYSPRSDVVPAIDSQHAIAVVGYNDQRVWVNDPLRQVSSYERLVFERAFALLASGVAIGPPVTVEPAPRVPKAPEPRPRRWRFKDWVDRLKATSAARALSQQAWVLKGPRTHAMPPSLQG